MCSGKMASTTAAAADKPIAETRKGDAAIAGSAGRTRKLTAAMAEFMTESKRLADVREKKKDALRREGTEEVDDTFTDTDEDLPRATKIVTEDVAHLPGTEVIPYRFYLVETERGIMTSALKRTDRVLDREHSLRPVGVGFRGKVRECYDVDIAFPPRKGREAILKAHKSNVRERFLGKLPAAERKRLLRLEDLEGSPCEFEGDIPMRGPPASVAATPVAPAQPSPSPTATSIPVLKLHKASDNKWLVRAIERPPTTPTAGDATLAADSPAPKRVRRVAASSLVLPPVLPEGIGGDIPMRPACTPRATPGRPRELYVRSAPETCGVMTPLASPDGTTPGSAKYVRTCPGSGKLEDHDSSRNNHHGRHAQPRRSKLLSSTGDGRPELARGADADGSSESTGEGSGDDAGGGPVTCAVLLTLADRCIRHAGAEAVAEKLAGDSRSSSCNEGESSRQGQGQATPAVCAATPATPMATTPVACMSPYPAGSCSTPVARAPKWAVVVRSRAGEVLALVAASSSEMCLDAKSNKAAHTLVWRWDDRASLEFPSRAAWEAFKRLLGRCAQGNSAAVLNIPTPAVVEVTPVDEGGGVTAVASKIAGNFPWQGRKGNLKGVCEPCHDNADCLGPAWVRVLYDLDPEDEDWVELQSRPACPLAVLEGNTPAALLTEGLAVSLPGAAAPQAPPSSVAVDGPLCGMTGDEVERMLDMLEKQSCVRQKRHVASPAHAERVALATRVLRQAQAQAPLTPALSRAGSSISNSPVVPAGGIMSPLGATPTGNEGSSHLAAADGVPGNHTAVIKAEPIMSPSSQCPSSTVDGTLGGVLILPASDAEWAALRAGPPCAGPLPLPALLRSVSGSVHLGRTQPPAGGGGSSKGNHHAGGVDSVAHDAALALAAIECDGCWQPVPQDEAITFFLRLGKRRVAAEAVYNYWARKRERVGLPLVRHFQPEAKVLWHRACAKAGHAAIPITFSLGHVGYTHRQQQQRSHARGGANANSGPVPATPSAASTHPNARGEGRRGPPEKRCSISVHGGQRWGSTGKGGLGAATPAQAAGLPTGGSAVLLASPAPGASALSAPAKRFGGKKRKVSWKHHRAVSHKKPATVAQAAQAAATAAAAVAASSPPVFLLEQGSSPSATLIAVGGEGTPESSSPQVAMTDASNLSGVISGSTPVGADSPLVLASPDAPAPANMTLVADGMVTESPASPLLAVTSSASLCASSPLATDTALGAPTQPLWTAPSTLHVPESAHASSAAALLASPNSRRRRTPRRNHLVPLEVPDGGSTEDCASEGSGGIIMLASDSDGNLQAAMDADVDLGGTFWSKPCSGTGAVLSGGDDNAAPQPAVASPVPCSPSSLPAGVAALLSPLGGNALAAYSPSSHCIMAQDAAVLTPDTVAPCDVPSDVGSMMEDSVATSSCATALSTPSTCRSVTMGVKHGIAACSNGLTMTTVTAAATLQPCGPFSTVEEGATRSTRSIAGDQVRTAGGSMPSHSCGAAAAHLCGGSVQSCDAPAVAVDHPLVSASAADSDSLATSTSTGAGATASVLSPNDADTAHTKNGQEGGISLSVDATGGQGGDGEGEGGKAGAGCSGGMRSSQECLASVSLPSRPVMVTAAG